MSASIKSSPSPPVLPKPEGRRIKSSHSLVSPVEDHDRGKLWTDRCMRGVYILPVKLATSYTVCAIRDPSDVPGVDILKWLRLVGGDAPRFLHSTGPSYI